jgi:phospholipid/cholesterol/gamma-HCH transport system substrate-binding protein
MRRKVRENLGDVVAVVLLATLAIGVAGFILVKQGVRFPVIERGPFVLHAEFTNARGVNPGQGQTVRVAGMRVGDIGAVELQDGLAVVRMDLEPEYADLVRRDATALLRPRTGLKDMFLELDPGTRGQPALEEGETLGAASGAPDINADEVLSALDTDSRAYLRLLLTGAGKGLARRGDDLREVFRRLGPLFRDVKRLNMAIATRRRNLERLVANTNSSVSELATRDEELSRLVVSSNRVFRAIGSDPAGVSDAVRRLAPTLAQAEQTFGTVDRLGRALPELDRLQPAVRQLDEANESLEPFARAGTPILRKQVRPLVRAARPYLGDVHPAAKNLAEASPDLRDSFYELNRFFNIAAHNPGGAEPVPGDRDSALARDEGYLHWLAWVANNAVSVFSTSDAMGPYRRFIAIASCSTIDGVVNGAPAPELAEALLGVTDLLNDPGLCPD